MTNKHSTYGDCIFVDGIKKITSGAEVLNRAEKRLQENYVEEA
jgi:hypothetical protein